MIKIIRRLLGKQKENTNPHFPVTFPHKTGQSVLTCTPLLSIYGSLFCVDNNNILFKDDNDNMKVLVPTKVLAPSNNRDDFEAYHLEDGFAIKYKEHDYFYKAKFDIVPVYNAFMVKLRDIRQPILDVIAENDTISVCNTK